MQQRGRNDSIAWGFVAEERYRGAHYKLKIYAGGRKIDGKNQNYAPHGSVRAATARKYSGKVFRILGTAEQDGDKVDYDVKCHIA